MADEYDPENQGNTWGESEGYGVADDIQHNANTQHSAHQDHAFSVDQAPHASGDDPSNDGASDVGDYDPEAVTSTSLDPPPAPQQLADSMVSPKPSPQPASKKAKTAGGFLVGDSDSEDDDDGDAPTPASNGLAAPGSIPKARSPLQHSVTAETGGQQTPNTESQPPHQASGAGLAPSNGPSSGHEADAPFANSKSNPAPDRIAILEDRVREDPRGAMDAWMSLIADHRAQNKVEEARNVYDRFLAVFPQAADIWVAYLDMELGMNNFVETERIFGKCLIGTPNVNLWTKYLDYIRRRNDLSDSTGQARQVVAQAYEFVIDNIGLDKDSGKIWAEYIQFIKFGPGQVGGSSWQDQQKMDQLRKAYQRAICVPIHNVNTLWKEYDQFEMGLNKTTGRKFLAERSPAYMSAKSANTALDNVTRGLQRTNLPRLPPAPGFDGDTEYMAQVDIWKRWIDWEKSDPLDVKTDEPQLLEKRILYTYKQALMALRFWPEMWVDAAEWVFENNVSKDGADLGMDLLRQGIAANPESVLLSLKHADRIEATYPSEENDDAKVSKGRAVREPYNKVLDTLYDMIKSLKEREKAEVSRIEETAARESSVASARPGPDYDDDYDAVAPARAAKEQAKQEQIKAVQQGFAAQTQLLSRTISFVWIALARAMRRIQGKGKPNTSLGGMRQVFTDARQRGRLTSDVYVAIAQLEWTVYKEPAGAKIFERGSKLFPEDENFTVEYLKFLHSRDDFTNARVVFETCVNRLTQKPELVQKAKPLYEYFHKYESQFGEQSQIAKLEKRMQELFPEDPKLSHFSDRFSTDKFNPIAARVIVSPATQLKPKFPIMPSIEQQPASAQNSPRLQAQAPRSHNSPRPQHYLQATNSPKRPFPADDFEDLNPPPRKIMRGGDQQEFQRGASPLKGAAGRRLDQQRRQGVASHNTAAPTIPRDVTFLLGLIPPAETYDSHRFNPRGVVQLLQDTYIPDYTSWRNRDQSGQSQYGFQGSRDSPNPPGRAASPYTSMGGDRSQRTYQQSSLRPGSSGSYERPPPAAAYPQPSPLQQPPSYGHGAPPGQQPPYDGTASWPAYGTAPPAMPPHGYAPPPPVGYAAQGPPQPQAPPYGRYPY